MKARFIITFAPPGTPITEEYTVRCRTAPNEYVALFIRPAFLITPRPTNDPGYLASLASMPKAESGVAHGSWDSFSGRCSSNGATTLFATKTCCWTHVIATAHHPEALADLPLGGSRLSAFPSRFSVAMRGRGGAVAPHHELHGCTGRCRTRPASTRWNRPGASGRRAGNPSAFAQQ